MRTLILRIDIDRGTWMVDVFAERNDNGIYGLVHPSRQAEVRLRGEHLHGFEYNIAAPVRTRFRLWLNDEVLAEGEVGHRKYARGIGIL